MVSSFSGVLLISPPAIYLTHTYTHTDTPLKPIYYAVAIDNETIELSNGASQRPTIGF